jgi:plasmid stabilization system protein ParE
MAYKISLTALAEADAYSAFERLREVSPVRAEKWLWDLFAAIQTLEEMPTRCPLIDETEELGYVIRHLLYGKRPSIYRIIFDIQEKSEEGPRVRVLRIWHGSRDAITLDDITVEH